MPRGYADIVMKGGITSGIVFPPALRRLHTRFILRNIGGTSAGAIAAAAAAAAELGERRVAVGQIAAGESIGFDGFERLTAPLGEQGFIFSLFQPTPALAPLFGALVDFVTPGRSKARAVLKALAVTAWPGMLCGALLLLGFGVLVALLCGSSAVAGLLAAAPGALIAALLLGLAGSLIRTAWGLHDNLFGMCTGRTQHGAGSPGLTDWLDQTLRQLAGITDRPVTFRDLRTAPALPGESVQEPVINLEMMTTNLNHQEPYRLPFRRGSFYFLEADMGRLFPADVVQWLVAHAKPGRNEVRDGKTYRRWPAPDDLPLVVAARMSLSFPVVLSAVPLYVRKFRRRAEGAPAAAGNAGARDDVEAMQVCWFSDGGLCSNLPLHFFDAPMPEWPTFAINLAYPKQPLPPGRAQVFLPAQNSQAWAPTYYPLADGSALSAIGSLAGAMISTMQNWRDSLQREAPGYRDRIVTVSLVKGQGGLNLNMPQGTLDALTELGTAAAAEILQKFDFNNHYWIRYRNVIAGLQPYITGFANGVRAAPLGAAPAWDATQNQADPPSYDWSKTQAEAAERMQDTLVDAADSWTAPGDDVQDGAPRPRPELRLTPTF